MRNKLFKNYQHKLNKVVRAINQNIYDDDLWLGRFQMFQKRVVFEEFRGENAGMLYGTFRIVDKATGYYKDVNIDYAPYLSISDWHFWEAMNHFITEDCDTWSADHRPQDCVKDYRKTEVPQAMLQKPMNYYLSYEYWAKEEA